MQGSATALGFKKFFRHHENLHGINISSVCSIFAWELHDPSKEYGANSTFDLSTIRTGWWSKHLGHSAWAEENVEHLQHVTRWCELVQLLIQKLQSLYHLIQKIQSLHYLRSFRYRTTWSRSFRSWMDHYGDLNLYHSWFRLARFFYSYKSYLKNHANRSMLWGHLGWICMILRLRTSHFRANESSNVCAKWPNWKDDIAISLEALKEQWEGLPCLICHHRRSTSIIASLTKSVLKQRTKSVLRQRTSHHHQVSQLPIKIPIKLSNVFGICEGPSWVRPCENHFLGEFTLAEKFKVPNISFIS